MEQDNDPDRPVGDPVSAGDEPDRVPGGRRGKAPLRVPVPCRDVRYPIPVRVGKTLHVCCQGHPFLDLLDTRSDRVGVDDPLLRVGDGAPLAIPRRDGKQAVGGIADIVYHLGGVVVHTDAVEPLRGDRLIDALGVSHLDRRHAVEGDPVGVEREIHTGKLKMGVVFHVSDRGLHLQEILEFLAGGIVGDKRIAGIAVRPESEGEGAEDIGDGDRTLQK